MIEIRRIDEGSIEEYARLCSFAFQYDLSEAGLMEKRNALAKDKFWGVFDGKQLLAGLRVISFQTYLLAQKVNMGGIASVATWPEFRRFGYAALLLKNAIKDMANANQALSFLFPFKKSFYRRYGWELVAENRFFTTSLAKIPSYTLPPGVTIRRWNGDQSEIEAVYDEFAKKYNGTIARDGWWWKNRVLNKEKNIYLCYKDHVPIGYMNYELRNGEMNIMEWINTSLTSKQAFFGFVTQHDSMAKTVKWMSPSDDLDLDMLEDAPDTLQVHPRHMARVVDIELLFSSCQFRSKDVSDGTSLVVDISDPLAQANVGKWQFVCFDQKIEVKRCSEETPFDVSMGISEFSAMIMGYKNASELSRLGRAQGEVHSFSVLDNMFPKRPFFSTDHF